MRRASLAGLLTLLLAAPCSAQAAASARLLGGAGALDGAKVGSPLTVRVAGAGVTSVRYEIRDIGAEGLHLRAFSSDNLVTRARIHATGLKQEQFGEGVYVGSANSNWSTYSEGRPDTSDRNRILDSAIWATGAESIDIKEGTTGGTVRGNRFDGAGMSGENHSDSLIDVKGDGWLIAGNRGTVSAPRRCSTGSRCTTSTAIGARATSSATTR